uniref:Uncharacterized protein n=1 Tax=Oryza brachyantha TaxID=4533 RepID=J3MDS3_ORYBR
MARVGTCAVIDRPSRPTRACCLSRYAKSIQQIQVLAAEAPRCCEAWGDYTGCAAGQSDGCNGWCQSQCRGRRVQVPRRAKPEQNREGSHGHLNLDRKNEYMVKNHKL